VALLDKTMAADTSAALISTPNHQHYIGLAKFFIFQKLTDLAQNFLVKIYR
jgi:hypothetical protein